MNLYLFEILVLVIIGQFVLNFFERRQYLRLIDQLTDKVMSRNYQDYTWGQEMKKEEKEEVVHRSRDDEAEAFIAMQNKKLSGLNNKAGQLAKQLDETVSEPVG